MIDAHIHVVPPNLPGAGPLHPLLIRPPDEVVAGLKQEMADAGVSHALAMGALPSSDDDPLGVADTLRIAERVPGLLSIGAVHPSRTDKNSLRKADELLASGRVKALKAYLGYLHFPPDHDGYRPYYELAGRHKIPFFFHSGDTDSVRAKLRFSHPLLVDDLAVDHPDVRFVLAHLGNPWLLDAAQVVHKNLNVWADLSGLMLGAVSAFAEEEQCEMFEEARRDVRKAFLYAERPNRFLYGSDWPLVGMTAYRDFIRSAIPEICHDMIFEENARTLFRIS